MYVTTGLHTLEGIVKNSNMFEYSYSQKKKKKVSNMFTRETKCKRSYYHVSKRKCRVYLFFGK